MRGIEGVFVCLAKPITKKSIFILKDWVYYFSKLFDTIKPMRRPNRDTEHLAILRDYFAQNHRIPSYPRIAELLGFSSRAAALKLMTRLEAAGYVARTTDEDAWIPEQAFFERPLADSTVRAGSPTMVMDVSNTSFMIDEYLVSHPSHTLLIPVRGDSMIEAGIYEGDLAVVERIESAELGAFVVANVDGEFTLKELTKEDGAYALKAHNARYPLIRPKGNLQIVGVMVGLVRRYTH